MTIRITQNGITGILHESLASPLTPTKQLSKEEVVETVASLLNDKSISKIVIETR